MSAGGKLLLVGFLLVAIAAIALLRFVGGDSPGPASAANEPARQAVAETTTTSAPPPSSATAPARTGSIAVETPSVARPSGGGGEPAPSLAAQAGSDDGFMIGSNGRPIPLASLPVLRAKGAVTDAMLVECIAKHGGKTVSGKAILTFQVGKTKVKGVEKIEVEATGIDEDGTTITNQDLLECMHRTAYAMTFDPHPSSVGVWAKRRVIIDSGNIVENWIFDYGHVR